MIYKILWNLFGEGLTKYYVKTQNKHPKHSDLEYRFTDSNGLKYYGFNSDLDLPTDRYVQLQKYATWMQSNLSKETMDTFVDKINGIIEDGVLKIVNGKRTNLIRLAALVGEMKTRNDMVLEDQIIYNIVCIQLVREDEPVGVFTEKIHLEKVNTCMSEVEKGNSFFLKTLEYGRLVEYSSMSPEKWIEFCKNANQKHKEMKEMINSL